MCIMWLDRKSLTHYMVRHEGVSNVYNVARQKELNSLHGKTWGVSVMCILWLDRGGAVMCNVYIVARQGGQ